jgi:hypothetical protein
MAELSHMLAIFMQQLCSSSLIVLPGVRHAAIGSSRSTGTRRPATSFEALLNIPLLRDDRHCDPKAVAMVQTRQPTTVPDDMGLGISAL